jgi:serine/threonine-protein kinase HipA
MQLRTLQVKIGHRQIGLLFQYGYGATSITRYLPDEAYWRDAMSPVLSWAAHTRTETDRLAFWRTPETQGFFNGTGGRLPCFFQNLLPEGPLRRHLEMIRGCDKDDHFEILAACGTDLPGNVYVFPVDLNRAQVANIVTQNNDALEVSVVAEPMAEATSLSGVQPKLSLVAVSGRYVARTKLSDREQENGVHVIAKLPTVEYPLLPEVEALSMQLAQSVGVQVAKSYLAPVEAITSEQPFWLGEQRQFLAVERFDRKGGISHIHCEDFAQILSVQPEEKYTHVNASYAIMAKLMLASMGMPQEAVAELLRRITVNEMLGNYDAHLKNFGVIYADGQTPTLSPAYDVVAYACYLSGKGHALKIATRADRQQKLSPTIVRAFCEESGMYESLAKKTISIVVKLACEIWPHMIQDSKLPQDYKARLIKHFDDNDLVKNWRKRKQR